MALSHSPKIIRNGLVLHLDAANPRSYPGSGSSVLDVSATGNNGVLLNGVNYSPNNNGYFVFDGTNDTIDCGPVSQIGTSLTGLTVSAWINTNSASSRCILENGTNHSSNTFYLFQLNQNYFEFEVYGGNSYDLVYSNYVYKLNTWYNLVGVWSSGSRINMYTNGVITNGTRGGTTRTTLINGNTNLFVGSRAGSQFPFSGNVSDVKIYNRALSAAEIQQNFTAIRTRYGI